MTETIAKMRQEWAEGDAARDAGLSFPEDVIRYTDIPYGPHPDHILDIYCPKGTVTRLPTIINIHGGGWFYGSKETYQHYCLSLARRGFTVVNFNYRLAPEHPYPAPLEDCCRLLQWVMDHGQDHYIDRNNLFTVGDSAGGQIAFQILTMLTNPKYAALFPFAPPQGVQIRACGMNCGCYFIPFNRIISPQKMGKIFEAYFPGDYMQWIPQLKAQKYITRDFPPAFVTTGYHDYLKFMALPLHLLLRLHGVESKFKRYGSKQETEICHVFHLNQHLPLAHQCNDAQCGFFRNHIQA